jgi:hypothetical protein
VGAARPLYYKNLSSAGIAALTAAQIGSMKSVEMAALSVSQIKAFDPQALASGLPTYLNNKKVLPTNFIASLGNNQISQFGASLVSATLPKMSISQIGAISTSAVSGISAAALQSLSGSQFGGFTQSQVDELSTAQIGSLRSYQISAVPAAWLNKLSSAQIQSLGSASIGALTKAQIAGLDTAHVQYLSGPSNINLVLPKFSANQISVIDATAVADISLNALKKLSIDQLKGLTSDQFSHLTSGNIGYLTPHFVYAAQANRVPGISTPLTGAMNIIFKPNGHLVRSVQINSAETTTPTRITKAADGSIYLVGQETGTMNGNSNNGGNDVFLSKFKADGTLTWSKLIGGAGNEDAYAVTTDSKGNAILTGYAAGPNTTLFADGYEHLNTSDSSVDIFVAKFSACGIQRWQKTIAGSNGAEVGNKVKVDTNNNIYISGNTNSSTLSGKTTRGGQDGFLMKLNSNGQIVWTKTLGSLNDDKVSDFTIGKDGAIYTTSSPDINATAPPAIVTKISSNGTVRWTQSYANATYGSALAITQGKDGNLYVVGNTQGAMDGQTYVPGGDGFPNGWNAYIGKLTTDGVKIWTKQYSPFLVSSGTRQISCGPDGSLYLAGGTFNNITGSTPKGAVDATLAQIGRDGSVIWSQTYGDSNDNYLSGIAL